MSDAVFPSLPGLSWDITRSPQWNTKVQRSDGGKELRASFYSSPIWRWVLQYEVLDATAAVHSFQDLVGFFNARQGMFDSFLYADPDDHAVTDEPFGTGDGTTFVFQLQRAFGGFVEQVHDLNGTPTIKKAGVVQSSGVTIGPTGLVTFSVAPATGNALTWTGSYYWRVRFDQDNAEFSNFASRLYSLQQLAFVSVK